MASSILPGLEKDLWLKSLDDGIYEIFLGWILIWMGLVFEISDVITDNAVMIPVNVGGVVLSVIGMRMAKNKIVRPRFGRVQFQPRRLAKTTIGFVVGAIILGGVFAFSLSGWIGGTSLFEGNTSPVFHSVLLAMFLFVLFTIHAFWLDYDRLVLIGILFVIPFPGSSLCMHVFGFDPGILAQIVPAVVIIGIGVRLLLRFLHQYPKVVG